MRLLTFIRDDKPHAGVLVGDEVIDLAAAQRAHTGKPTTLSSVRDIIEAGPDAWARLASDLKFGQLDAFAWPLADLRLAPPLAPSKIMAIGQNYADHVREQNGKMPDRPILFAKLPSSVIGHGDAICWEPALSEKIDWEAELAVVIGKTARRVRAEDAYDYVFGYTMANDVTARDLQRDDGQWVRGKSLDTFCPLGPWIVTRDEIPAPHGLRIRCRVNGDTVQDSRTDQLIFDIPTLIAFLSRAFTLYPGDIILTGTPPGVGHFRQPPRYLRDGDAVEVEIEDIGVLKNICRTETGVVQPLVGASTGARP
jgi:2-keto-4-pentenoate hydratase/2-oxohepta-3-ene-1,7-dioic acid hydratase in catechol pathway